MYTSKELGSPTRKPGIGGVLLWKDFEKQEDGQKGLLYLAIPVVFE